MREVGVGFANRSLWSIDADLGDRAGDNKQFGYRVNLGYRDGEQAVERYGWEQKVASVALDWRAAPGLVFNFNCDHVENQNPELPPFYFIPDPTLAVPNAPDTKRSAALSWDDYRVRSDNTYLRGDWTFAPNWTLTAQALHNHKARPGTNQARFGSINNADGDISLFGGQEVSSEITDSGQLLVHGAFDTASIKHHMTAGLTGSKMKARGKLFSSLTRRTFTSLCICFSICSSECSSQSTRIVIRETSRRSVGPTVRLSMLNPRRANMLEMRMSAPGLFSTSTDSVCLMRPPAA